VQLGDQKINDQTKNKLINDSSDTNEYEDSENSCDSQIDDLDFLQ